MPTRPPKLWPSRMRMSPPILEMNFSVRRVYSSTPHTAGGSWLSPKPGKSML